MKHMIVAAVLAFLAFGSPGAFGVGGPAYAEDDDDDIEEMTTLKK